MQLHLLTVIILLPLAGVLATVAYSLLPRKRDSNYKWIALAFSIVDFALSLLLVRGIGGGTKDFRFVEDVLWIGSIGAHYHIGVDGISLWLVLLTTLLMPIAILSSWTAIQKRQLSYYTFLLLLLSAMIGVFVSLDLLLFYLFFEASLVPMFFLIGIWGGERKIYAAIKFFIYTAVGSLLMLVGIIALYYIFGTFDYTTILAALKGGKLLGERSEFSLFLAFAFSFCIKVPVFPLHTWLPDAHTEAPTAGSVILAGVLLKLGTYGFLRFGLYLFPKVAHDFAPILLTLGVIGIVYGAIVATVQRDLKRLVAYSSVAHLGFIILGTFALTTQGVQGGLLQMINHGLSTGALFLLVGMVYERRHTRQIADFGGLQKVAPVFAGVFMVVMLSSVGLPGLNGFVGEFLVLLGTFITRRWWAVVAATGVILAAVYLLWAYQRVFHGVPEGENLKFRELRWREGAVLAPVLALIIFLGVYPKPVLDRMAPTVKALVTRVDERSGTHQPAGAAEGKHP